MVTKAIRTNEEFQLAAEKTRTELFAAAINYGLYVHLAETLRANRKVFGRGRTFWGMILDALMTQTVLTLCRVYDIHHEDKTCSLRALLKWREGQNEEVADDLQLIDRSDQAVMRLIDWRDNVLAHTNRDRLTGRKPPVSGKIPKHEEIHPLIDRALGIVSRHTGSFSSRALAEIYIPKQEADFVLEGTRKSIEIWEKDVRAYLEERNVCPDVFLEPEDMFAEWKTKNDIEG